MRRYFFFLFFPVVFLVEGCAQTSFEQVISEEAIFSTVAQPRLIVPPSFGVRPTASFSKADTEGAQHLRDALLAQDKTQEDFSEEEEKTSLSDSATSFLAFLGTTPLSARQAVRQGETVISLDQVALRFLVSTPQTSDSYEKNKGDPLKAVHVDITP